MDSDVVVLFDGTCAMCSRFVRFVLDHESSEVLLFVPNASEYGRSICEHYSLGDAPRATIVLIKEGAVLTRSEAVLALASFLRPPYSWARYLRMIPRPIRDVGYNIIARYRHVVFGRATASCLILSPAEKQRVREI